MASYDGDDRIEDGDSSDNGKVPAPTPTPGVNPVILDAVDKSTRYAFGILEDSGSGTPGSNAASVSAGKDICFNKVSQACGFAVQDAVDYQRNMMTILQTVQGQAMAIMFADEEKIPQMTLILAAATEQMAAVTATFSSVSAAASASLAEFK